MISVGRYEGRVIDVVMCKDQGGGDQVEMVLQVTKGDKKGDGISFYGSFAGDAGPYTLDRMMLAGFKIGARPPSMIGNPVEFVVREEVYKGNPRLVADIVRPISSGKAQTPDERRITSESDIDRIIARAASTPKKQRDRSADFDLDDFPEAHRGTR